MEFENEEQYKAAEAEAEQRETIRRSEEETERANQEAYKRILQNSDEGISNSNAEREQMRQDEAQRADEEHTARQQARAQAAANAQSQSPADATMGSGAMFVPEEQNNTINPAEHVQFNPVNSQATAFNPTPQYGQPQTSTTNYDPNVSPDYLKKVIEKPMTLGSMTYDPTNASDAMQQAVTNANRNRLGGNGDNTDDNLGAMADNTDGNLGATADNTNGETTPNEPKYYLSDEMLRAKHVPTPFWISKWRKEAWDESMAGFNKAEDPAEMVEQLIWGMIDLGPKMYLAYLMHRQEQEINIKNAAQTDREEYDKQLLLMKNMSPIDFNKNKANWVYCSEELHRHLRQRIPGIKTDENGYVDWKQCSESQQKQIKEGVIEFVKDPNGPYKDLVERFTRREFSEDELGREGRGLAELAKHYMDPAVLKNLKQSGNDGSVLNTPNPPHSPNTPNRGESNGLNAVLAQAQKGKLSGVQPYDTASLTVAVQETNAELRNLTQILRENMANGSLIEQARAGRQTPQYGVQINMKNPYGRNNGQNIA